VALGFHLVEDFFDGAVSADQKSRALDAQHFIAVHVFLFQNAIGLGGLLVHVAEKNEWEPVLFFEACLCARRIRRDAQNDSAFLFEFLDGVTKLVRFLGSTRRVGPREKIEDNFVVFELRELEGLAGVTFELDVGSFIARLEHDQSSSKYFRNSSGDCSISRSTSRIRARPRSPLGFGNVVVRPSVCR